MSGLTAIADKNMIYETPLPPSASNRFKKGKDKFLLVIGKWDFSAIGKFLCDGINKYVKGWRARCIVSNPHSFRWPTDLLEKDIDYNEMKQLYHMADFILYTSSSYYYKPHGITPPPNIPRGIWHGGVFYRQNYEFINELIHPHFDYIFTHYDLVNLSDRNIELQAPIDTEKYKFNKKKWNGKLIIGHSPSRREVKKTEVFLKAFKILDKKFPNILIQELIEKVHYDESMERKKECHIFFDQILQRYIPEKCKKTRGYGTSLIEAGSFGSICLCDTDRANNSPIIRVRNKNDIVREISKLINNRNGLEKLSKQTRRWVEKTHDIEILAKYFIDQISDTREINIINNRLILRLNKPLRLMEISGWNGGMGIK